MLATIYAVAAELASYSNIPIEYVLDKLPQDEALAMLKAFRAQHRLRIVEQARLDRYREQVSDARFKHDSALEVFEKHCDSLAGVEKQKASKPQETHYQKCVGFFKGLGEALHGKRK